MTFRLLDFLRGVAILWVFALHLPLPREFNRDYPVLATLKNSGYVGVIMTFVISGYCLAGAARKAAGRGDSAWRFLLRRWTRILPPFWASVLLAVLVQAALGGPCRWAEYGWFDWLSYLTLTQGFAPLPATHPSDKFDAVLGVYWTLAVEVQFYAVLALALAAFGKHFLRPLAVLTVVSLPFAVDPAARLNGSFLAFWPFFAMGLGLNAVMAAGWTPERVFGRRWLAGSAAVLLGLVGLFGVQLLVFGRPAPGGMRLFPPPFAAYFTLALWPLYGIERRLVAAGWAERRAGRWAGAVAAGTGALSYSLYLTHMSLHPVAGGAVERLGPHPYAAWALVYGLTCLLCYPFYRWVERPLRGERARPAGGRPATPELPPPTPEVARAPGRLGFC